MSSYVLRFLRRASSAVLDFPPTQEITGGPGRGRGRGRGVIAIGLPKEMDRKNHVASSSADTVGLLANQPPLEADTTEEDSGK